ncbi:MAG TPA: DNA-processing protein DprA [Anaerohalosphaeraceae bacterium]|jgi:DNA processing protein|nr:DNA-processing protein DprA [Anaerohalosphaeraceae bacterium]HRT51442.1 DNA-processing protein DprA [Anaerohalosphaeraceae bacterium]HRT87487.1 DNA-processing protein DprA [Anaerohalosphaeraceae bacterium]
MTENEHSPDIEKWLTLIRADGVGPTTFARLLKHFGSLDAALEASVAELAKVKGIGTRTAERIKTSLGAFDVRKELALAEKHGVYLIHAADKRYPPPLRAIYDPPPVLYVKGTLQRSDSLAVAIVGSRRCSTYGAEQAGRFAHLLASAGFTIVSGMARGIDTAAHRGALTAKGRTIAVQGCGLANIFPAENAELFKKITENGACISELPLSYEPLSENFPSRNRIIAGLCMAVLVVEASERSGALITAQAALDNNREVMAVPGKIDSPLSIGSHRLIKQGARLVDSIEDIMETLGRIGDGLKDHALSAAASAESKIDMPLFDAVRLNLSAEERSVYDTLDGEPRHVDEIIAQTTLAAGAVNSALVSLRLKGLIRQLPGSLFTRKQK